MKILGENSATRDYVADAYFYFYTNALIVTAKGLALELPRVLTTYMIIDLSRNRFEGHIPNIIGDLVGLRTLNLSHNGLEVLNLSHNHLVGCIPKGKQFDTFENSSYQGNDGLRG
ncbi:receptor-like protein Cf-9 homolog [Capsicum annuum]|uniref:receptor-like protein Cf-9 homolog n=1 Tax=Capsicum annuum TaxID=4072 RepID=UPI001FB1613A|nr:receptor-like protein Cf-9 homolog [Capsicum annuum]